MGTSPFPFSFFVYLILLFVKEDNDPDPSLNQPRPSSSSSSTTFSFDLVNVYYVMGFRPSYFTCIAHLYLYYTLLVPHTYASYIRHWCIFSHYEIQYKSSNISNMVSEPLLWPFFSSHVFISMTPFSISLPPSQQPPQPFAVEPLTSSSRCPWVSDLQPPSLWSFTLQRPLLFASPLQTLLRLRFWRYHKDCLASIYKIVKASMLLETTRAPTRRSKFLYGWSRAPRTSTRRLFRSRAPTRRHAPPRATMRLLTSSMSALACTVSDVILWL